MRSNNPMGFYLETSQGDTVSWDNVEKETFVKAYLAMRRVLGRPDEINGRRPDKFQVGDKVMVFHPEYFARQGLVRYISRYGIDVEFEPYGHTTGFEREFVEKIK